MGNKKLARQHASRQRVAVKPVRSPYRTWSNLQELYRLQHGRCGITGNMLPVPPCPMAWDDFEDVDVDHILPLSCGGTNELDNLQLTTPSLNYWKGSRTDLPCRHDFLWAEQDCLGM